MPNLAAFRVRLSQAVSGVRKSVPDALVFAGLGILSAGIEWAHPGAVALGVGLIVIALFGDS